MRMSESPTRNYDAGVFGLSNPEQPSRVMSGGDVANATGFLFKIEANQTSHFIFKVNIPQMDHVYLTTLKYHSAYSVGINAKEGLHCMAAVVTYACLISSVSSR